MPDLVDAYKSACDDAGHEPGKIILQAGFSWAEDDDAAFEGAKPFKATMPDEFYADDYDICLRDFARDPESGLRGRRRKAALASRQDRQVHTTQV